MMLFNLYQFIVEHTSYLPDFTKRNRQLPIYPPKDISKKYILSKSKNLLLF